MIRWIKQIIVISLSFVVISGTLYADTTSLSVSPTRQSIPSSASTITISWLIKVDTLPPPSAFSFNGDFLSPDGKILFGNDNFLTIATPDCFAGGCRITETVSIPASVLSIALQKGYTYIRYRREFKQGGAQAFGPTADVALMFLGVGTDFSINRIGLRFTDGSRDKVSTRNSPLQVEADISYTGSGILDAIWEISTPPTSVTATPIFRLLKRLHTQLPGTNRITLLSPQLPTTGNGLHLLRLRVTKPTLLFETPIIQYRIGKQQSAPLSSINNPQPLKPIPVNSSWKGQFQFNDELSWQELPGTSSYLIEVFATGFKPLPKPGAEATPDSRKLLAGIYVEGKINHARLSELVKSHIEQHKAYQWRIVALNKQGIVQGVSEIYSIKASQN